MHSYVGKKVLVTTQSWFLGNDGKQYRAVYGTLKGIHEAGKMLGFIPNRSHANWFIEVGNMTVMGCQVMYIIQTDKDINTDRVQDWANNGGKYVEYERPTQIFVTE